MGEFGTILKTIDGGESWTVLSSGTTNHLTSVYFLNSTTGFAVGGGGTILKTTDGGIIWTSISSGTSGELLSVFFPDSNTGYVGGFGILKTIDGGSSWTSLSSASNYDVHSIYFTDANIGYAVCGGIIIKTINGGITWTFSSPTCKWFSSVYFTDANTGYVVGDEGTILKTTNGGGTFNDEIEYPEQTFSIYPNPANNKVAITGNRYFLGETIITIFDINGKQVMNNELQNQNTIEIDVSTLEKGMYLLKIETMVGIECKKLFIQ